MRIGQGYDIHQLVKGYQLTLGGVVIPYHVGALGHSDADVLLHALIDAILGALALGDIGMHFPDNEKRYYRANSQLLLTQIVQLMQTKYHYQIINIDSTIIIEAPKLRPYIVTMRQNIANVCGISLDDVSIKAKTNEGMDALGQNKAVAAHVVVLLEKKKTPNHP